MAGAAKTHAIQFTAGLRLTTHSASATTTAPTEANTRRPLPVSAITGNSTSEISCAASRTAEGWWRRRKGRCMAHRIVVHTGFRGLNRDLGHLQGRRFLHAYQE